MAVLSDTDRSETWAEIMRDSQLGPFTITNTDLRAAVDAADAWADSNAAGFNAAIPQPARAALTPRQKAALLNYVIARRFKVT